MNWLRRVGLAYRLRGAVLLVAFAIGSLLARDALLVHEAIAFRAALQRDPVADEAPLPAEAAAFPSFEQPAARPKLRPSGLSRRAAINPWDSPDDDDDLDEDSDTVAAAYVSLAILPARHSDFCASPYLTTVTRPTTVVAREPRESRRSVWSRGPPV